MIKPGIGRQVWFTPAKGTPMTQHSDRQPFAATVVYVWGDEMINIAAFDHNGVLHQETSVTLLQDREPSPTEQEHGRYCEWMPFQKGQAASAQ